MLFKLVSDFVPRGDQVKAIPELINALKDGKKKWLTLLGVTGSGKTFTLANIIEQLNRPVLIISHNKTLAAQLYQEFKSFFPHNAVEYFVSYYDYYQPESYLPQYDKLIEKETSINEEIEIFRGSTTRSLIERRDVIVVASVSCIYGLGSPEHYRDFGLLLSVGTSKTDIRQQILLKLVDMQYVRTTQSINRRQFRARGDTIEVWPSYEEKIVRIELFGDQIEKIKILSPLGELLESRDKIFIWPCRHYVMPEEKLQEGIQRIHSELDNRIKYFHQKNLLVEEQRIRQRTEYDLEMMATLGYCNGIENYSAPLENRKKGEYPNTLIDFFPRDYIVIIDESHVTLPQITGMVRGDRSRKKNLIDYGFRLPSAYDNRPLSLDDFIGKTNQVIFVSATPSQFERERSDQIVEQIIRPTGLIDPVIDIHKTEGQIDDLLAEIYHSVKQGDRILVTTMTKRMSEYLTDYLRDAGVKARYLHSEIATLERNTILRDLRQGKFDVLVGINLLREGLDLPEVALIAILDADKAGFLRTDTALIQTIGRASRNIRGRVIMYADSISKSMEVAIRETQRRRRIQEEYNQKYDIAPESIQKKVSSWALQRKKHTISGIEDFNMDISEIEDIEAEIAVLKVAMRRAADDLQFEKAAEIRDRIKILEEARKSQ